MECHGRTGIIFQGVSGTPLLNTLRVERGRSRIDAQKGISAQVFGGSTQVFAMAVSGKEKVRFEHSELHGYFKPRPSTGRRYGEKRRHSQVNAIGDEGYHLREEAAPYMALFKAEKCDIDPENAYFWDINTE